MLRYVPRASWRVGMLWGSHPIGPDKMPSLTPFSRSCPLFPAELLPSK